MLSPPNPILTDEPTNALDTKSSVGLIWLLRELNGQGHTVIEITREPKVAAHAHRVLRPMLGIIIGIASMVLVAAPRSGPQQKVLKNISSLSTDTITSTLAAESCGSGVIPARPKRRSTPGRHQRLFPTAVLGNGERQPV